MELSIDELAWLVQQMRRHQEVRETIKPVLRVSHDKSGQMLVVTATDLIVYEPDKYRLFVEEL